MANGHDVIGFTDHSPIRGDARREVVDLQWLKPIGQANRVSHWGVGSDVLNDLVWTKESPPTCMNTRQREQPDDVGRPYRHHDAVSGYVLAIIRNDRGGSSVASTAEQR